MELGRQAQSQSFEVMSLRFAGLKPRTLRSYNKALLDYFIWLEQEAMPVPKTTRKLDDSLAEYLEHLFLDDRPIAYAGHTLSALKRFHPRIRWKIPLAKQYFSNWKQIYVTRQAVPMPVEVLMAVAGVAASCKEWGFCTLLLLGYAAFLRTSEMVDLSFRRLYWNSQTGQIIMALPATKTSRVKDESVEVTDSYATTLLNKVSSQKSRDKLWPGTTRLFRRQLAMYLDFLGLSSVGFTPYSIRRGGASFAFSQGYTFDTLLVMGRWQSIKTARIYLDSGRSSLIQLQLPHHAQAHVQHFGHQLSVILKQLR